MKKLSFLILISLLMTGCSIKKEGVFLGSFEHSYSSIEQSKCKSSKCPKSVVLVGTVSAYRNINENIDTEYRAYQKAAKKFVESQPISLSLENFEKSVNGWTMLQTYNIPLIGALYSSIFIPSETSEDISYASTAEAFLVQGTGDLVAAISNSDGLFFLKKLLCSNKRNYRECKKSFRRGIYDGESGKELDSKFSEKENGNTISLRTFEVVKDY